MPTINWNVILVSLLYAAATGILNLVFSKKSQINEWASENPRLAAVGKLLRSIGFDPHNFWAFLTLLITKKLPKIQLDGTTQPASRRIPPGIMMIALAALSLTSCSLFTRTNAKTAAEIAHDLCVLHFSEAKPGLSIKDLEKAYCQDLDPWISTVGDAETMGAAKAAAKAHQ